MRVQVHDLLEIHPGALDVSPADPHWIHESLVSSPWVVVRRDRSRGDFIPVGIRGSDRSQRWGGHVGLGSVRNIVRPWELLLRFQEETRTPALAALRQLRERWSGLALQWGPAGSVGFELASGRCVITEASDLDIVIRTPHPITRDFAWSLWERAATLEARTDIRIETPRCGFSLEEYARSSSRQILLRFPEGVRLGSDPWSEADTSENETL